MSDNTNNSRKSATISGISCEQSMSLARYLIKTCATAYYCDIKKRTIQVLQDDDLQEEDLVEKVIDFDEFRAYYIEEYVHPEDKELMREKLSIDYFEEVTKSVDSYDFTYREFHNGIEKIYRGIVIRGDDEGHVVVLFINITEEFRRELEQNQVSLAHKTLVENNDRVLALNDNFKSLYDVDLNTGEYELYMKGESLVDDFFERFGEKNDFFSDLLLYIENVIYPDDRTGLVGVMNRDYIRKVLELDNHFDWHFRICVEEKIVWCRLRVVYKNNEKRNVIIGIFNAEEEIESRRKEEMGRNELINRMVADDGLFVIDCWNNTRKTLHNHCYGAENYSDEESYSDAIARYISQYVAEGDREMMTEVTSAEYMMKRLQNEQEYKVEYRDRSMGTQRFCEMRIAKFSSTEVLQSFTEKDKEIVDRMIFRKLEEEYFSLLSVNLDDGLLQVLRNFPQGMMGDTGTVSDYTTTILELAKLFDEETKEFLEQIGDISYLRKRFANEDKATFIYRSHFNKGRRWGCITGLVVSRHEDGTPAMFSIGFSLLDEDASRIQDYQIQLQEDMHMISGLANGYLALYYINLDEKIFKVYSLDGKRISDTREFVGEKGDFLELFNRFSNSESVYPEDRALFAELNVDSIRERLAHKKKFSVRFRRKYNSEYLWSAMDVVKYEEEDERANVIAVGFSNISDLVQKEQEYQQKLENALNEAESANKSKTSFLFNMSHDIRTPMNAMIGFTAMARKYIDDREKVCEYLEKIDISGHQLLTLINQVLEMARIESGKVEFDNQPVNMLEKFNSMVTVLTEQARANGLEFRYATENILHANVFADVARMGSITLNIAGNAMKYTPEGGRIDFVLSEKPCDRKGFARYMLTVVDTGIGMSEEYLKKLFEPFSREKNTTVSKIQGTGLGMSIVKSLVDLLGGTIEVQSTPGAGTRFDITCDFEINESSESGDAPVASLGTISFDGRRVLLVEDNEMNREIAKNLLEESGFVVDEAEDGDVAVGMIEKIAARKEYHYYDCILMDVQMPRMNGYEATRAIRSILYEPDAYVPIIAMTANAFEEDRRDALAAGMDEHLTKPIDIQSFFGTLMRFVGGTK